MEKSPSPAIRVHHFAIVALLLLAPPSAISQKSAATSPSTVSTAETRTAHALDLARTDPLNLYAFLKRMPKGADLHNHLGGAVYAESWIRAGAEDNLCVNTATLAFAKSEGTTKSVPPQPVCGDGRVSAASAYKDQHLYDALVDAFSMRSFVPSAGV